MVRNSNPCHVKQTLKGINTTFSKNYSWEHTALATSPKHFTKPCYMADSYDERPKGITSNRAGYDTEKDDAGAGPTEESGHQKLMNKPYQ